MTYIILRHGHPVKQFDNLDDARAYIEGTDMVIRYIPLGGIQL